LAVFEEEDALDRFEAFASLNGPAFYRLPVNEGTLTLEQGETRVPDEVDGGGEPVVPFHAGETLNWRIRA
ncbi:MAG: dihydroorotase, partial [Erythrobacter sp.]|nr:dihydroorotase [Erythrobacter sp.]